MKMIKKIFKYPWDQDCLCVCVCYDELVDEAVGSTNPEPSKTTEEHTDSKKVDPVTEEKPLKQGTNIYTFMFSFMRNTLWIKMPFYKNVKKSTKWSHLNSGRR